MVFKNQNRCTVITSVFAVVGIVAGCVTLGAFPSIFNAVLESQLALTPDSFSYSIWKEMPLPLYMSVYFLNITNWEEIRDRVPGEPVPKPHLVQVGPYVWRQYQVMEDIDWHDSIYNDVNNHTVSYKQNKTYEFQPEMSKGSLDDIIVSVNVVAIGATEFARNYPASFIAMQVEAMFEETKSDLFYTQPVRNITFDGILDPLMAASAGLAIDLPLPPFDKFGWFYERSGNLDYDGYYNMFTGTNGLGSLGQIAEWNNSPRLPENMCTKECGEVRGSAGQFFPPNRDKTYVDYFSSDVCRTLRFTYKEEVSIKGVWGYKYSLDTNLVNNSLEENMCFNPFPDDKMPLYAGLMNVSACKWNAPAYVSYPHFLHGDQALFDQFDEGSLNPTVEDHESYIVLEPISGVPLEVAIRLQINTLLRPLVRNFDDGDPTHTFNITMFDGLPPTYYPTIWFEEVVSLPDDMLSMMKLMTSAPKAGMGIGIGLLIVGFVLGVYVAVLVVRSRRQSRGGSTSKLDIRS